MSKMGQELDRKLDENKYVMYELIRKLMRECEVGYLYEEARKLVAEVEGKDG